MIDLIKKTMYMGLGLASLTKEKMEEVSRELVKKGELSEKEGKDLVDDLAKKSEEAKKALDKRIDQIIKDTLARLNVATKDDLKALEKKLSKKGSDKT